MEIGFGWVVLIGNVNNSMALPEEPSAAFTGSKGVPWLALIYTVRSLFFLNSILLLLLLSLDRQHVHI